MQVTVAQHGTPRICAYCRDHLDLAVSRCGGCAAAFHAVCVPELRGCLTLGCAGEIAGPPPPLWTLRALREGIARIEELLSDAHYANALPRANRSIRFAWLGVILSLVPLVVGVSVSNLEGLVVLTLLTAPFALLGVCYAYALRERVRQGVGVERQIPEVVAEAHAEVVALQAALEPVQERAQRWWRAKFLTAVFLAQAGPYVMINVSLVGGIVTILLLYAPVFLDDHVRLEGIEKRLEFLRRATLPR